MKLINEVNMFIKIGYDQRKTEANFKKDLFLNSLKVNILEPVLKVFAENISLYK